MRGCYFFLFIIFCPFIVNGQSTRLWNIQPVAIKTRWVSSVNPENVWPEYPRPQFMRKQWQNLNGLWSYAITDSSCSPASYDGKILVPYPVESALSGVKKPLLPSQALWYRRIFEKPKSRDRTLLHFGAVDWKAIVYLNGRIVGEHLGGYTTFSFDITDFLIDGENELKVKVYDPTDKGIGPHGKQSLRPDNIYYTASSGIWQTVWMEDVYKSYIESMTLTPNLEKSQLNMVFHTKGVSKSNIDMFTIRVRIKDGVNIIKTVEYPHEGKFVVSIPKYKLWSPDDPFLYDLDIELLQNGVVVDKIGSYFGMRDIKIKKDKNGIERIFLNNKYTYNLGILDQGFWPEGLYTAPNDYSLRADILASKLMGFNTIRKHIKVEPARWYYHADKLGMLVWQDFVNPNQQLPKGAAEMFEKHISETVKQLYNIPSIIAWVIFNEKWGQYDQQRITEWVKTLDSSRLVNGHSGELLYVDNVLRSPAPNPYISADMTDVHSYPFPRNAPFQVGKARVLGEFGGIGVPVEGHLWDDLTTGWGYNGVVSLDKMKLQYGQMIDSLKILEAQGLSASIYTQPFDVESEQNGLLTYDRSVAKIPLDTVRAINSKIWPPTASHELFKGELTFEIPKQYEEYEMRVMQYSMGRNDSAFLRGLVIFAAERKDDEIVIKASDEYFNNLVDPYAEVNLRFIQRFIRRTTQRGFAFFMHNVGRVDSIMGENSAEMTIMNAIYNDEIAPHEKEESPDWNKIEVYIRNKYGALGEERVWGNMMVYYNMQQDWSNFGKYYKLYFDRAISHKRSFIHINNLSWPVFEHITDTAILETAIKASKYNIEELVPDDPDAIDTYANLLYKIGRIDDAIAWERKAARLAKNDSIFMDTLMKMEKGQKTWN